jgi:hypothetical protein
MTDDPTFDRHARQLHAASLDALSPRVQAQLAQRRRAALASDTARRATPARWGWAGAAATACVLVVALQLRPPAEAPVDVPRTIAAVEPAAADPGAMLAEDPEFYLWLASGESQAYAVE